jgi:branched-chain amino acid transport system permease protein
MAEVSRQVGAAPRWLGPLDWLGVGIRLPLAVIAIAVMAMALSGNSYNLRILTFAGIYALLVVGYQFIFGHAGALSLAQGTFFGVGAYVTGILGSQLGWPFLATFPLSIVLPAVLAVIVAAPILRLESHYFALATLGIGQVVLLLAINWEGVTGGANGIPGVPGVRILSWDIPKGWPLLIFVWTLVLGGAGLAWQITRGLYGRAFEVMRENAFAAMSVGIDIGALRFVALILSALYAGAAGALYVHTIRVISPEALEFPIMVACLTMAVVGGRARIAGAIIGAVLLIHLPEWFRFLDEYYLIAYGVVALIMIIVAPYGLVGALERLRQRLWPEPAPAAPSALVPAPRQRAKSIDGSALLEVQELNKAFGGIVAADNLNFEIERGEIVGLIGPNGSGKTTLVNLITGIYRADKGQVLLGGVPISGLASHEIARRGIARTFQNINLVDDMTALDNVAVACGQGNGFGLRRALTTFGQDESLEHARGAAMHFFEAVGVADDALKTCGELPYGIKRRVEIARALALDPDLLILDEPAAGLNEDEQDELAQRLQRLAGDGLTLFVIEHNMPFLMPLAKRMICLDYGRVIAVGTPNEVSDNPAVIEAYLGPPEDD